jgi:hypothetical protein
LKKRFNCFIASFFVVDLINCSSNDENFSSLSINHESCVQRQKLIVDRNGFAALWEDEYIINNIIVELEDFHESDNWQLQFSMLLLKH